MSADRSAPGASMPRMNRGSMVAQPWRGFTRSLGELLVGTLAGLGRLVQPGARAAAAAPAAPAQAPEAW
ncbi:hypothetical protein, partial [Rhizobacter sp. P5_C2]